MTTILNIVSPEGLLFGIVPLVWTGITYFLTTHEVFGNFERTFACCWFGYLIGISVFFIVFL